MASNIGFIWKKIWRPFLTLLFPALLSPVFMWKGIAERDLVTRDKPLSKIPESWKQSRAVFLILLMGCYWVSECLPLPVTSLLPIVLIPMMGIADADTAASKYLSFSVMLLIAGCIVALAFEYSNLHIRIALGVAKCVGARLPMLLGGIMLTAMVLSMWMNNTSTTAMMVPIVMVIIQEFENVNADFISNVKKRSTLAAQRKSDEGPTQSESSISVANKRKSTKASAAIPDAAAIAKREKKTHKIKTMFMLGVAYAANIGGTGIITGTATNLIAKSEAETYEKGKRENKDALNNADKCFEALNMSFVNWLAYNALPMLLATIVTWLLLLLWFNGIPRKLLFWKPMTDLDILEKESNQRVTKNIEKAIRVKHSQLGPVTLHEILVFVIFLCLIILWITAKLGDDGGWSMLPAFTMPPDYKKSYTNEVVPAFLLCGFLFILPKDKKYYKDFCKGGLSTGMEDPVLPWREVEAKLPWGPLLLVGGGIAMSSAIKDSGLGLAIGYILQRIQVLKDMNDSYALILVLILVAVITTVASNTATASILSSVLLNLAETKGAHPLYFLEAATVAASYSFVLPISTPPNAIVFEKAGMKQMEMALPGLVVTLVTNAVLFLMVNTYCNLIFGYSKYKNFKYCAVKVRP